MFPKHYVYVVDLSNRLLHFRLYENAADARRAIQSWRIVDGGREWKPSYDEKIIYNQSDLTITAGLLSSEIDTFHSLSEAEIRAKERSLPYEILAAAKEYERQSLLSSEHRRSYYRKKYQYWLNALVPIALVTVALYFLRKHYAVDPIPNLSLLISVVAFSVVASYLHKQFGSWVGAVIGAIVAWIVWGLLAAVLFEFILGDFTPLFGWQL
jgi:hypothetical protein